MEQGAVWMVGNWGETWIPSILAHGLGGIVDGGTNM